MFFWGMEMTSELMPCSECGNGAHFLRKKGMRVVTLFFIIPTIPISGVVHVAECRQCKTRYRAN